MIKGCKICGISDSNTLNFLINHPHPPTFIGFICNYPKSSRYVEYENLKKLLINNPKQSYYVAVLVKPNINILEKIKSEDWEKTIQVNVNSHFYFTKYAIPMIKKSKHGSIVNISSTAGIDGFPNRSPYAASKWALVGITKTLAMELGKFNIRVNAICPGSVKGARMMRVIKAKAKMLKQSVRSIEKDFVSMSSLKQWVYEDDIAKMCSFLISQDSLRVSGQVISIDGNTERMD